MSTLPTTYSPDLIRLAERIKNLSYRDTKALAKVLFNQLPYGTKEESLADGLVSAAELISPGAPGQDPYANGEEIPF